MMFKDLNINDAFTLVGYNVVAYKTKRRVRNGIVTNTKVNFKGDASILVHTPDSTEVELYEA